MIIASLREIGGTIRTTVGTVSLPPTNSEYPIYLLPLNGQFCARGLKLGLDRFVDSFPFTKAEIRPERQMH